MNDQTPGNKAPSTAGAQSAALQPIDARSELPHVYRTPVLTRLGTLVELTLSGSVAGVEQSRFTANRLPPATS